MFERRGAATCVATYCRLPAPHQSYFMLASCSEHFSTVTSPRRLSPAIVGALMPPLWLIFLHHAFAACMLRHAVLLVFALSTWLPALR